MNKNTVSAECYEGMHEACVCENACACSCHQEDECSDTDWDEEWPEELA